MMQRERQLISSLISELPHIRFEPNTTTAINGTKKLKCASDSKEYSKEKPFHGMRTLS
jgi:hypothetical protein